MPFFDFACPNCNRVIEVFLVRNMPDAALPVCKYCDVAMQRQPSAPSFAIKGYNAANGYAKGHS